MTDREFMLRAACNDYEPEWFFPTATDRPAQDQAIRVCETCPVLSECNDYANKTQPSHGVWAGRFLNTRVYHTVRDARYACGTEAAFQRHLKRNENPCGPCDRAHDRYRTDSNTRRKAKR